MFTENGRELWEPTPLTFKYEVRPHRFDNPKKAAEHYANSQTNGKKDDAWQSIYATTLTAFTNHNAIEDVYIAAQDAHELAKQTDRKKIQSTLDKLKNAKQARKDDEANLPKNKRGRH